MSGRERKHQHKRHHEFIDEATPERPGEQRTHHAGQFRTHGRNMCWNDERIVAAAENSRVVLPSGLRATMHKFVMTGRRRSAG